jgi:hypothetical protein
MSPELITLHLSQLQKAIEKSKTNKYADSRKQGYHTNILNLFEQLSIIDYTVFAPNTLSGFKNIIDFCFVSIEFLDNSTLVNIPHEIVYCLEKALNQWDDTNQYIIVTSLHNDLNCFSFNALLSLNETFYDTIQAVFGISFDHRLIQINLPKYLAQDYLANVVLYHELGHFVDRRYQIIEKLSTSLNLPKDQQSYYCEFFSDIFAAQYIGEASNYYLNYIAYNNPDSVSHPSTDSRIEIVSKFLNKNNDKILNDLIDATQKSSGKELKDRRKPISDSDFKAFIPTNISDEEELHSIFEVGWGLWLSKVSEFEVKNISKFEKYQILNNLIEKSISNYMVLEKWNRYVPY